MPRLWPRPNGYWYIDARDLGLGYFSLRTRHKATARQRYKEWLKEYGGGERIAESRESLETMAGLYLREKQRYDSPRHADRVAIVLKQLMGALGRRTRISTITRQQLQAYLDHRRVKPSTVNKDTTVIKAFFRWLVEHEYLAESPAASLRKIKTPRQEAKFLTQEQFARLLQVSPEHNRVQWQVLVLTGLRKSEFEELRVKDVRFELNRLHVRSGKGAKSRWVPMTPRLRVILEAAMKGKRPEELLFKKYASMGLSRAFRDCCEKAGLEGFTLHSLRHTYASHLLNRPGANIAAIAESLGHSIKVLLDIYTHVIPHEAERQVEALDRLFAGE